MDIQVVKDRVAKLERGLLNDIQELEQECGVCVHCVTLTHQVIIGQRLPQTAELNVHVTI